jgi:hypothetical protein
MILTIGEGGELALVDQRNLNAKASFADITAKVKNNQLENVRKLAQAHDMTTKRVHVTLHRDLQL